MDIEKKLQQLREYVPQSLEGWLIYFSAMATACLVSLMLRRLSPGTDDAHVPLIFVLAVLVVSLTTNGYFYGILTALTSVVTVNFAFTYPYDKVDFTDYSSPLTFMTMLAVGCAISALTSRVREQEKLRRESEQEKLRANLLRAVSHDLRTPLTAISGSISAVLDGETSLDMKQRRELLENARKDADWLCRMVENLLSITRISNGEMGGLHTQEEILEEVLSEAVWNFKKRNPSVEVAVSVPETLLFVPMDAMLIEQVLINLLDNAATHGQTTSYIRISAEADKDFARVKVEDNGTGVDVELLERLFEGVGPLKSEKKEDSTRGMGIGLSVCRTIIEAHGGTISVSNLPQGGALFEFTLPMGGTENEYQG